MFFKLSFVLTILSLLFFSATARPVISGSPSSLLGRTFSQRTSGSVARAVELPNIVVRDQPLKRDERFNRRLSNLNRIGRMSDVEDAPVARSPEPQATLVQGRTLKVVRAPFTGSN